MPQGSSAKALVALVELYRHTSVWTRKRPDVPQEKQAPANTAVQATDVDSDFIRVRGENSADPVAPQSEEAP